MKKRLIIFMTIITIVGGVLLYFFKPLFEKQNLGLDLQGGFEIKYRVESITDDKVTNTMIDTTCEILTKRIDNLGVTEPEIIKTENNQIIIKLPGIKNEEDARKKLNKPYNLTFRDTNNNLLMTSSVLKGGGAKLSQDDKGRPAVALSIKDNGTFFNVTNKVKDMTNNMIVIWLDFDSNVDSYEIEKNSCGNFNESNCLSAAYVNEAFTGDVIISGNFTQEEANELTKNINSGSLPTKLVEVSSNSVSGDLGDMTLNKTLTAGIIGILLIMILMTVLYRFAGLISSFGILIYGFLTFLLFYLINGTLTLSGIAAIIIGIGMAVDANIITFERIKEELFEGRSLTKAFENGNKESFSSIIDGNITTFIVAIVLFNFGESSVRGFGLMLMISIITTIIVMVYLIRWLLKIIVKTKCFENKPNIFINVNKKDIPNVNKNEKRTKYNFKKLDFISKRKRFITTSIIILLLGIGSILLFKLNLGIEFNGGTQIMVSSENKLTEEEITKDINALGYEMTDIDLTNNNKSANVKLNGELNDKNKALVKDYFSDKYNIEPNINVMTYVGKKEMASNALGSLIIASLGIIIYVTIRFRLSYAISGVIALFHDAFIIVSIFSIFRLEVNSLFIAAVLAIIGYSINDTIIIFDQIRENIKSMKDKSLEEVVNKSIRQTFLRSIYTSITTIITVLMLIIVGSYEIINFNIALFIGLIAGTYSSIYLASQIWISLEKKLNKKTKNKKKVIELSELEIKGINK
ncbi:MAG: protein translocase subunit SecF [Bacilli bacterium]